MVASYRLTYCHVFVERRDLACAKVKRARAGRAVTGRILENSLYQPSGIAGFSQMDALIIVRGLE
jgi:hypothetical protein